MKQPPTHAQTALARALSAAQRATGSRDDVARLRDRLQVALGAESQLSAAGVAAKVAPLTAAKLWIVSAALLAAGAGLYGLRESAPSKLTPAARPLSAAAASPESTLQLPAAAVSPAPSEPTAVKLEAAPSRPEKPLPAAGHAATKPLARKPARGSDPKTLATAPRESLSEVELISQAHSALATDPRSALALLTQHAQLFEHGVLSEERDILRFDAERALGMEERAREHARAFMQTYPSSAHRRRIEQWLLEGLVPAR